MHVVINKLTAVKFILLFNLFSFYTIHNRLTVRQNKIPHFYIKKISRWGGHAIKDVNDKLC